ncbi:hypothetical protein [Streptomyces sp. NPDC001480]|uniref:hypothetical protein n=1 Tax=Streptomyces sp. NPDC001480 TaxID=3364577 RepID=UPI0036943743
MPTFRQPEWQQQADRHSQLVDPVLTVRQLSRFEFNLKSYVRIDNALVFSTFQGEYKAYLPPLRPTRPEIVANRYTAVYEVDMGVHRHTSDLLLPSDNDALEFTAEVDLDWQVLDPARFVSTGHRDVPALLLGELQQAARPVTRRFAVTDSAAAEAELLERMRLLGPLGATAGLQVTWTLRVRRDQANIEHELRKQAIGHSADEQILAAHRGMDIDVAVDLRGRQQDALQIERAMAYGQQQQVYLLQQQQWQHQQALLAGQQQMELQRLEAEKINFYQYHLQQGGVHAWALHLAQHPEDSGLVMNSMREDQLRMIQAQMELVKQLMAGDAAENWELEGPKQLALRTVSDILNQRLPGVPQTAPPLAAGEGPVYPQAPAEGAQQPAAPGAPDPAGFPGPYGTPGMPPAPGPYGTPAAPPGPGQYGVPVPGPYAAPSFPGAPPAAGAFPPPSPAAGAFPPPSPAAGAFPPASPAAPPTAHPAAPAPDPQPPVAAPAGTPAAVPAPPPSPAAGAFPPPSPAAPPTAPPTAPPAVSSTAPPAAPAPDPQPPVATAAGTPAAVPAPPPAPAAWEPPPGYGSAPTQPGEDPEDDGS